MEKAPSFQEFLKLLEENGRETQGQDLSLMSWYLDGMERQFDAVLQELAAVKAELAQVTEQQASSRSLLAGAVEALEWMVEDARDRLTAFRDKIMEGVKDGLERFKDAGVSALDSAISAIGVKKGLEHLQEGLQSSLSRMKDALNKMEEMGSELRSAGAHLKNAGRTLLGKEAQVVDGGQEGRLQSVVLAPMRATQRLLSGMNNATLAAIGSAEHLEQRAAEVRAAKAERTAEKPGKRLTKRPSIRQDLEAKKLEAAARAAVPDRERKPPEAAR